MKTIFIAYADEKMAYSLKRIGRQAGRLGVFDEIILYTPRDLPDALKQSPLMQHSYGGGYWAWKPWIIMDAVSRYDDAAVCYVDAGCTLNNNREEWNRYLDLISRYDTILYQYPDEMPVWAKFGTSSTRIKHWAKKDAVLFYDELTGGLDWREHNKILGGFIWARGKDNPIIKQWHDIVMNHPEIIDDSGVFNEQFPFFVRHKHDQPMLTALSCKFSDRCIVLPELLDEGPEDAAVVAERVRVANFGQYLIWVSKKGIKKMMGQQFVSRIKSLVKR